MEYAVFIHIGEALPIILEDILCALHDFFHGNKHHYSTSYHLFVNLSKTRLSNQEKLHVKQLFQDHLLLTSPPEANVCQELGIQLVDNLGEKIQSSSSLTKIAKK